jgi:AmiR/NasT family two-component response regulator
MTLAIPISPQAERRLADKAKAAGVDLSTFVSRLIEAEAQRPNLVELSGEIFEKFRSLNMTDEQLGDRLEEEKHVARAERRGEAFTE